MNNKALIAMSGGVDSSVAAHLMKEQGYECIGVTMKLFNNDDAGISNEKTCCSLDDVEDARNVASSIGIPYYVLNFKGDFTNKVIDRFVAAYQYGFTPNPCIDCNRYMKFDKLFLRAKQLDIDYIVTGHYSRTEYDNCSDRYLLKRAVDSTKDQSYVLYSLTQEQLKHTVFPLGAMNKSQVREIAERQGFVNARKKDSQDICFVQDNDYSGFIEHYTGKAYETGDFIDENGKILGKHKGIIRYTIGQRKGLGLALPESLYVKELNVNENTVVLGKEQSLYEKSLIADDFNWIAYDSPTSSMRLKAKVRYKHTEVFARVEPMASGRVHIEFDAPQRAITKGQAVVLYDDDVVVGGGTIIETRSTK